MSTATDYWERRYVNGGISGPGSRGAEAQAKANIFEQAIERICPQTILDLGCGDGMVASIVPNLPEGYVGYDPSPTALERCRELMPHRTFIDQLPLMDQSWDLVVSMDVIFHLVHDHHYAGYLFHLLGHARRHILVYGTNHHQRGAAHVLHREWIQDIPPGWDVEEIPTEFKSAWLLTWKAPERPEDVRGLIAPETGTLLERLAEGVPKGRCVVEIGAYTGCSTCYLARGVATAGAGVSVYSIDPHGLVGAERGRAGRFAGDHVRATYLRNLRDTGASAHVRSVRALSAHAPLPEEPVGLLWIDGDHSAPAVSFDVRRWAPLVAPGGFIVFDDHGTYHPGVNDAVKTLMLDNRWTDWELGPKPLAWARRV